MLTRSQRRAKTRQTTVLLAVLASSAVAHAAVVATLDLHRPHGAAVARPRAPAAPEVEWTFTCASDALLAATVRIAACGGPFGDRQACLGHAVERLTAERSACDAPQEVEVAFVDVDKLDLMPVPLLEDVRPTPDTTTAQLIADEVAAKLEEAKKTIEQPKLQGQVVEITRPEVEVAPIDAHYLAEFDSKVTRQTAARASTEEMVARPQPRDAIPTPTPPPVPPDSAPAAKPGVPGAPGPTPPSMLAMRDPSRSAASAAEKAGAAGPDGRLAMSEIGGLAPRTGEGGASGAPLERAAVGGPAGGAGGDGGVKPPELRPSNELLERAVGGGSVDDLDDAETGDFTALNTRKWKYAGFFNRMKRQVAQSWHPDVVYGRHDPTGQVYGAKDRVTVLQVSLTPNGSVAKVYVVKASGVEFLDDEAERAFREAQPFPNPPSALVDADSKLITFSFGFNFQIGGDRSTWRIFRQN